MTNKDMSEVTMDDIKELRIKGEYSAADKLLKKYHRHKKKERKKMEKQLRKEYEGR